ncbi:diaminopimelate decarboxylase [Planctomycetales bacterium]|nr:diaminopimelate decarboxylase [Planctomycetales bacterium]
MDAFTYRDGELFCEAVAVEKIAREFGAPVYVYSERALLERYRAVAAAFNRQMPTTVCYSVKSCANVNILRLLAEAGSGFDIVSGGELFRVLQAGGDPRKIVFAGVAKTADEIRFALDRDILLFNCESEAEVLTINDLAAAAGKTASVALRVNPDIDAHTHAKTTTAKKENKFGIEFARAKKFIAAIAALKNVVLRGVDAHLGSPINTVEPYALAAEKLLDFLRAAPDTLTHIDIGGGFGLRYHDEEPPEFAAYAQALAPLAATGKQLIVEPGRSLVGNAAVLLAEIQYVKTNGEKTFYLTSTGMNDLIRPALYDAYHFIWNVKTALPPPSRLFGNAAPPAGLSPVDVTGPVCESSDVFAKDRRLPPAQRGDLLAIFGVGAYGFSMSSNYNSRPRPPEILVSGERYRVIRRRETYEDLIRGE